jgi:hypothetical protein
MNRIIVTAYVLISALMFFVLLPTCEKKLSPAPVLDPGQKAKIIIEPSKVVSVTSKGVVEAKGVRQAVIAVTEKGDVIISAPQKGFIFEPGLCAFTTSERQYVGLDVQWYFWKRWGVYSGAGMGTQSRQIRINVNLIGVGYTFNNKFFSNTSVFTALTLDKKLSAGIRVKF